MTCHFINSDTEFPSDEPALGPLEKFIMYRTCKKGMISYFYNLFLTYNKHNVDNVLEKWERDLKTEHEREIWDECIQSSHTIFLSNRFKEMQYRILHRQHRTPEFLNKIDPSIGPHYVSSVKL